MNKRILLAVSLLLFSVIIGSQLASSDGEETIPISVVIANDPPEVRTVTCTKDGSAPPIDLNESSWGRVVCSAVIYDLNDYTDVEVAGDANGTLVLNSSSLAACNPNDPTDLDNSTCYFNNSCTFSSGSGTTVTLTCDFIVWWYMEASSDEGDFTAWIKVQDGSDNIAMNSTDLSVNDLLALNVTDQVNWGGMSALTLGTETVSVNNTGNVQMDLQLNATNMTCNAGSPPQNITPQRIAYNSTSATSCGDGGGAWSECCKLTGKPDDTCAQLSTNFDLAEDATGLGGVPNSANFYLTLNVSTGVQGTCDGNLTVTAVKG